MEQSRRALELVTRIGEVLLKNGGEIFRVQQTMQLVAKAYGIPGFQVYVLANGLFVSMQEEGRTITLPVRETAAPLQEQPGREHLANQTLASQVRYVPLSSVHLGRVAAVNNLSREIVAQKYTVEEASRKIEQIDKLPFTSNAVQTLMSGLGAGAFCILFGGSLLDSAAAFLSGLVLWIFVLFLTARGANKIMVNILASALVTAMGVLFFHLFSFGDSMDMIVIGSIVPLLPGVPLTNSIRDYLNGDYLSGTIRMIDAVLVAFVATVAFGVLFQVPKEQYAFSGICGAAGWLCYLLVMQNYPSTTIASFAAAVVLTMMSRIFAVWRKTPVTVFLICGIFPLVPGAGIYYTAYYFIMGDNAMALSKGIETIKIAVAIALAIVFVFSMPNPVAAALRRRK